ncbi:ATPase, T2SS/T4P/T4SS family [Paenibacillus gallinarum]|uniref:Flp pilus assembly complex ATPase component TadA n=1 Tax=Paenibacillus gallinarum TaxID=2762232 RepID=A0ABR8SXW3_9BACL|nr:ATPase, T2SS/T4P/T4SS family [Paenibacillus gallinarum]MBD7968179.1 Flp pilus assembly complex ATPase component TadA [Paenibacillus gallinarum]
MNIFLLLILSASCILLLFIKLRNNRKIIESIPKKGKEEEATLQHVTEYVKQALHELSHSQLADAGLHEEEYKRKINQRAEMRRALKDCISGSMSDKHYVKKLITDVLIHSYGLTERNINEAIPFDRLDELSIQDQFEIIFYIYQQQFGVEALSKLIDTYDLAELRRQSESDSGGYYEITSKDIMYIFECEYRELHFLDKVNILVQRVYQHYKGFSVVDDIRDQQIDGVSAGVSGILGHEMNPIPDMPFHILKEDHDYEIESEVSRSTESVWIFYRGKTIHLSFLSFGSERELKRVCQNIYKYNHPGQLSESKGYKVNEMKDGSRVVVVRPPFSESWAFFVRKFDLPSATLPKLITGANSDMVIELIRYLMKGCRITSITGAQGSGKTTLLMAMIEHIYPYHTLRVQEMAFELHLRKLYSKRNILSFRETDHISGQQGLDLQKKTDGTVNILGEVASDEVAAWMIQMSQVASLFTVFTHHAKTFPDLIFSLRNSLLKVGMFRHEHIAEEQVASVLNFDIHLKKDADGGRYIERITECVPDLASSRSGGEAFTYRNIVEYRAGMYHMVSPISSINQQEMISQMSSEDATKFEKFAASYWGRSHVS